MRRKPFMLSLMSAALLGVVLMTFSCKKEAQEKDPNKDRATSATIIIPSNPTLSGVLGTGHNVKDTIRLTSSVGWRLSGLVYVDSADVLIIDPGTTIKGNLSTGGASVPGGGLVVCRGAKLLADGGACTTPIVFTSAATTPQPGDWSGVIILGNASSNHANRTQIEGVPSNPPANATYGGIVGTNDADNSGIIRYVRIEYAGFALSLNNEINGLTFGGVGSGTIVDNVCVYKANDDAFEWFGGTVNASHLIATNALDDMFDTDNGYRGTIRFALGLADTTRADQSQSNGIESDNNAAGDCATPITNPQFRKITLIGVANAARAAITNGAPSGTGRYGRAAHLRRNTSFDIDSAVFVGWTYGLSIDTALGCSGTTTATKYRANHATWLTNTVAQAYSSTGTPTTISRYITEPGPNTTAPGSFYNYAIADGNIASASLGAVALSSPFTRTPTPASAAAPNFYAVPGTPATTVGKGGAFPGNVNWICGTWARVL